jgi:hypothetical protein
MAKVNLMSTNTCLQNAPESYWDLSLRTAEPIYMGG